MKVLLFYIVGGLFGYSSCEANDLDCLTANIYHEARGEPLDGQVAVGVVTLNRVASSRYPDTVCEVVMQKYQFSWTNGTSKVSKWGEYNKIKDLAHLLLTSEVHSEVGSSMYYHNHTVNPYWNKNMVVKAVINNHIFYSD